MQNATYSLSATTEVGLSDYQQKIEIMREQYSSIVNEYSALFALSGYYIYFGKIGKKQGWIIHLSIVKSQINYLLSQVIPYLIRANIPFKMARDMDIAFELLDGRLGYTILGKIISIYPEDEGQAPKLVRELIPITKELMGPPIPTDRQLHNIIYTRYGSFNSSLTNNGNKVINLMSDDQGNQIPDPYNIPFKYPSHLHWPFSEFVVPYPPPEHTLLNYTYYPLHSLKSDAKGKVIKALYFRKLYQIKSCLIKEGKQGMFSDIYGRDIRDRLKWQYQVHKILSSKIPLPKSFSYYQHNENDYFVMEYIKGDSLGSWLERKNKNQPWKDLPTSIKIILVKKFIEIINVIHDLHESGFVHRDINQYNILVTKNQQIILIDMELAWSIKEGNPSPPFQLGTRGFMSPEQAAIRTPTVKEDIYALGAMLVKFLSNISPNKLTYKISKTLVDTLSFFTGEFELASLVFQCLKQNPIERPTIAKIKEVLTQYNRSQTTLEKFSNEPKILYSSSEMSLPPVINAAIKGLSYHELLSTNNLWLSKIAADENYIVNNTGDLKPFEGWHTGMAGPIWVLARAKLLGFDISVCDKPRFHSWENLKSIFWDDPEKKLPGLYQGIGGIAMTLAETMNSGLLPASEPNLHFLSHSFAQLAPVGALSFGVAGQGIALLHCRNWLQAEQCYNLCKAYIQCLLDTQNRDGSWSIQKGKKDNFALMGFSTGVTGIVWFLLAALQYYPNDEIMKAVSKALQWLRSKTKYGTQNLALTFIKAYELYQDKKYKKVAEKMLCKNPARKVEEDFSLKSGLTALGETYLEAALVFRDNQWLERAQWIAQVFAQTMQKKQEDQGFWVMEYDGTITADLFNGSSGILHFLLRVSNPGELSHPLWPIDSKKGLKNNHIIKP